MLTLETLRKKDIRDYFSSNSFSRARQYIGLVENPVRRGDMLFADVRGTRTYHVEIEVTHVDILAECTCPYDWGGYCKHIGAVLLLWIEAPYEFSIGERARAAASEKLTFEPVKPPRAKRPKNLPAWMTQSPAKILAQEKKTIRDTLTYLTVQNLRKMASQRGWKLKGTRKTGIVDQLLEKIIDPAEIHRAGQSLTDDERIALLALIVSQSLFFERINYLKEFETAFIKNKNRDIIEYLRQIIFEKGLGLVKPNFNTAHYFSVPIIFMPHLPPLLTSQVSPLPDLPPGDTRLAVPFSAIGAATQLLLLFQYETIPLRPPLPRPKIEKQYTQLKRWDYVPAELTQWRKRPSRDATLTVPPPQYALPDDTLKRIAPMLGGIEQAELLYRLLLTGGLIYPGSPVTVWQTTQQKFLERSADERRAWLVRRYMETTAWSELWHILRHDPDLRLKRKLNVEFKPAQLFAQLQQFREKVITILAYMPANEWLSLADVTAVFRKIWRTFDSKTWVDSRDRRTKPAWQIYAGERALQPADSTRDWDRLQGAFIRQVCRTLHQLGAADLHVDAKNRLQAVRLLDLKELLWGINAPSAPRRTDISPEDAVRVDGADIFVTPAAPPTVHLTLNRIAKMQQVTAAHTLYRLDVTAVHQSFENGDTLDDLLAAWQQFISAAVPAVIREQLAAWWQMYGQVRLYRRVTLIEFADDHTLLEMKAATSLAERLIAELSPRAVLIPADAVEPLVAELENAGYTPKITEQVT